MKKVVCFGLCLLIVLASFVLSFADSVSIPSPYLLPVSDGTSLNIGVPIPYSNGTLRYFSSNNSPVYICFYDIGQGTKYVLFSDFPDTVVYNNFSNNSVDPPTSLSLSNYYNGYYFTSGSSQSISSSVPVLVSSDVTSIYDVIDSVSSSVFGVNFNLSYLVDGSISWFSTFAEAVKNNGLLLFMVLFGFVGIGIGLLRRFHNG